MAVQSDILATDAQQEMSRREFLNYAWLASLGLVSAQSLVLLYQFAMPRLGPGEFGGPVDIGLVDSLPGVGAPPEPFARAKFWWVMSATGARAIYKVCTHLGCIYQWKQEEFKFVCPCHGSQFEREGKYIQGPAGRSLDRLVVRAFDASGKVVAETPPDGGPVKIPAGSRVVVETGMKIIGQAHA
ncbi:MAG: Rieske 2Fe-2S domain-containing protein [Ardenticatenales bacterium]